MDEASSRREAGMTVKLETDTDFSNWMGNNFECLKDRKLTEIALPGSHDAGMYKSRDCSSKGIFGPSECNTKTQAHTIADQLSKGIRYFDLRPIWDSKYDYLDIGHFTEVFIPIKKISLGFWGCLGCSLEEVLEDVSCFAAAHPNELVLLLFSHYLDRRADRQDLPSEFEKQLTIKVKDILGPHLVKNPSEINLLSLSLEKILDKGSVIALFDNVQTDWPNGVLNSDRLPITGEYSDTEDFNKMAMNQFAELDKWFSPPENKGKKLFLLSWTLTQSDGHAASCCNVPDTPSIEELAKNANSRLAEVYQQGRYAEKFNFPNILLTDYCDDHPTRICQQINAWGRFDIDFSTLEPEPTDSDVFGLRECKGTWQYYEDLRCRLIGTDAIMKFQLLMLLHRRDIQLKFNLLNSPYEPEGCQIDITLNGNPFVTGFEPQRTDFYDVVWPITADRLQARNELVLTVRRGSLGLRKATMEFSQAE